MFYYNPNWSSGTVSVDSPSGLQAMTQCSVSGWNYLLVSINSSISSSYLVFNQGNNWDHSTCNTQNNYDVIFNGNPLSVNSTGCGGSVDTAFGFEKVRKLHRKV